MNPQDIIKAKIDPFGKLINCEIVEVMDDRHVKAKVLEKDDKMDWSGRLVNLINYDGIWQLFGRV